MFSFQLESLLGCLFALSLPAMAMQEKRSKLLLVSFDGFRWDYINRVPSPNFHAIMEEGVQVERVVNAYITKTLPNHHTLVTGLHAESHGVVANEMFDPILNRSFSMEGPSMQEPIWWQEAVPLWVTNQRAGGRSGAMMWPGSDVEIHGVFPTRYVPYNSSVPFQSRVETLLSWFTGPEPIDFGMLYWEEPDESGHNLGPETPLMDVVIADIDEKLGLLRNELKRAHLYDDINLIVTSDHGMTQLSAEKIIELDNYVSRDQYTWVDKSPVVGIVPKEGCFDEVYSSLLNANPNLYVYKKDDIPEEYHYKDNERIMPILLEAREGWTIVRNKSKVFMMGNHGYNNSLASMHPIFVARGPDFRVGYTKDTMHSVDLYPLMCHILSVPPMANNGSLTSAQDLLAESQQHTPEPRPSPDPTPRHQPEPKPLVPSRPREPSYAWVAVGLLLGTALVVFFLFVFVKQVTLRQLPSLPLGNREISQPLLYEELRL